MMRENCGLSGKINKESLFIQRKRFIITVTREYIEEGCQGHKPIAAGHP